MKIRQVQLDSRIGYRYYCPGCAETHVIAESWGFNGNYDSPTVTSSVKVSGVDMEGKSRVCHHYIRQGQIQFLPDCTHSLAGQTLLLGDVANGK